LPADGHPHTYSLYIKAKKIARLCRKNEDAFSKIPALSIEMQVTIGTFGKFVKKLRFLQGQNIFFRGQKHYWIMS